MSSDKSHRGILGIHHITTIASGPQKNIDFYTNFVGLRLVKLTVNFDDPQTVDQEEEEEDLGQKLFLPK
jgi:glyoxalase family protein